MSGYTARTAASKDETRVVHGRSRRSTAWSSIGRRSTKTWRSATSTAAAAVHVPTEFERRLVPRNCGRRTRVGTGAC